ncbi:MAG: HDIG domain-containing protein [Clostridia bacterium]|nr:HDIG domain-containing protein [Clostridia bacterium]
MRRLKTNWKVFLALAISFVLSFAIILTSSVPESYDYTTGDICTDDIYATREIEDKVTTQRRQDAAASQVENQYSVNFQVNEDQLTKLQNSFAAITEARNMEIALTGKISFIKEDIDIELSDESISYLVAMNATDYSVFSQNVRESFSEIMDKGVIDTEEALSQMEALFLTKETELAKKKVADEFFKGYTKINEEYNAELTELERDKAKKLIEPTVYKKNQIIVRRGEVITDAHISLLSDMGMLKGASHINVKYALGILLLMMASYAVSVYYIMLKSERKRFSQEKIIMACILPVLMLLIVFIMRGLPKDYAYLVPLPYCAILMATFVSARLSSIVSIYLCFAASIMLGQAEEFIITMITFSTITSMIFKKVEGVSGYAKAMVYSMAAGTLCAAMAMLMTGKTADIVVKAAIFGALNGLISSVLTIGTTPIFENIFNIITPFKLNDLGNPEKPLLKRLMFEAPGTYHHCLMVGNLAEAACMRIGANNQLARVSAYYHDIGKLRRPGYFFENQMGDNPHDALMPAESAKVLRSHVEDGLEIARQYRLPKDIRNVIAQHHGATLTGFFYKKALEMDPDAREEDFRYPGPKPESKEAGIVMLADSCEAAVRSLDDKTEESIRAMVTKIVKSRMAEGELDECDLSFRELGEIIDAFVSMLGSHFHKRIKYDDKEEKVDESADRTDN